MFDFKMLNPVIVQSRVDDHTRLPECSNAPVSVKDFQLFASGLVWFSDTDTKKFISHEEQRAKATAALNELELKLTAVTDYYDRVGLEVNAGRAFKEACTASRAMLDYNDSKPYSLAGLQIIADGKFYFTGNQYALESVQRLKAQAILAAVTSIPEDFAERMLFEMNVYSTWLDSVKVGGAA